MQDRTIRWDDYRDRYRGEWESSNPNRAWDDTEPGFRYGWESAQDPRYRGREYMDSEADLQRGWSDFDRRSTSNRSGTQLERTWDNLKESVQQGWERARQEFRDLTR